MSEEQKKLTYKDAGVDVAAADAFVNDCVRERARRTFKPGVLANIGGFASLFSLAGELKNMVEPVLVSSTDGVGTKLLVAKAMNRHDTIGIDLVAMCVNDVLACGAKPLFFLDYIATAKLENGQMSVILDGIARGCEIAGISLVGGETAEMPDVYEHPNYDLAGFAVGVVDKATIKPNKNAMVVGDVLLGLESSGYHSNGYSLLRKLGIDYSTMVGHRAFGDVMLTPTKIYANVVSRILPYVKGIAHITGGGIPRNVRRIIPDHLCADIDLKRWERPRCFSILQEHGVSLDEALQVFNMGIGMVCIVDSALADDVKRHAELVGEVCHIIGNLSTRRDEAIRCF